jgi:anion-transporting  ArsA/GET3 family ATPase
VSESDHNAAGWTFDTLYIHVMEISKAAKEGVNTAMTAAEKANEKAEKASEKRFDAVNEFRAMVQDQQATFANKEQTEFRLTSIDDKFSDMDKRLAEGAGKMQGSILVGGIIAWMITTGIALFALLHH